MDVAFLPGIASGGPEAWRHLVRYLESAVPDFDAKRARFHDFREANGGFADHADWAVEGASATRPVHVIAHSFGGNGALLAAQHYPERIASLTLFEPAALALTRHTPATEAHIAQVGPIFACRADLDCTDAELGYRLLTALGGRMHREDPLTDAVGRTMRQAGAPWEAPLDRKWTMHVPTLVITGGWDDIYEDVARHLESRGATHLVVPGAEHRPQDLPPAHRATAAHIMS
ncbi:alpha/beta fold hydrolase [Demequina muriae]|uniref:Alpha/beta hydrolase n=1 Tax=Demequina muriae TaxID=3051664 RepID=A0ABT8GE82_9MICO|nr:alpha/beta hydrolase [Demequina sp. EGI L300058]MDN4479743.1 alpha/beta hydrolase [Demequina sp. EGI L300058]